MHQSHHARANVFARVRYEFHYPEFNRGHDYLSWRETLADALILLMGNNSTAPSRSPGANTANQE